MDKYEIRPVLSLGNTILEAPYDECNAYAILSHGEPMYVFEAEPNQDLAEKRKQAKRILDWVINAEGEQNAR